MSTIAPAAAGARTSGAIRVRPGVRVMLRLGAALAVVGATVAVVGAGSFWRGLAAVSPLAIIAAAALAATATAAASWRWTVVANRLGVPLTWREAVVAYYRSQFLNTVLPDGVLGDVHRAWGHGRRAAALPAAARAVATERIAGQVVQLVLVVAVLGTLGSTAPLSGMAWPIAAASVAVALGAGIALVTRTGRRIVRRELAALRAVIGHAPAVLQSVVASIVVVVCHAATFVVACLAVGIAASPRQLVALALVALVGASIPLNVGGWGLREALSASASALAGLGAGSGLAASAAFGVLTMITMAPGAIVLVADRIRERRGA